MSAVIDALKEARKNLRDREWPKSKALLAQLFPEVTNAKYIAALLRSATAAQRDSAFDEAEQLAWLAIEIYDSGRDENADVITCIKMLHEIYTKSGREKDAQQLSDKTFGLVLGASEGLLRSIRSLTKQLSERGM